MKRIKSLPDVKSSGKKDQHNIPLNNLNINNCPSKTIFSKFKSHMILQNRNVQIIGIWQQIQKLKNTIIKTWVRSLFLVKHLHRGDAVYVHMCPRKDTLQSYQMAVRWGLMLLYISFYLWYFLTYLHQTTKNKSKKDSTCNYSRWL